MDVYLIIGDANTGKSSLLRSITGYNHGYRQHGIIKLAFVHGVHDRIL